jgi:hypothetical protein
VELVALLPLLVAVALGAFAVLAAGRASEFAGHAAEAGAVAILQDRDPAVAARDALPGWSRRRARIRVEGRRVEVTLTPPFLGNHFAATETADAGPPPDTARTLGRDTTQSQDGGG